MRAATSIARSVRAARAISARQLARQPPMRMASTLLRMPAMSPTMTEGGIASWKKKEGEAFEGGDVILEVETDKATIDVEAQDDGVMGKIVFQAGSKNVPVGEVIAVLAEEGDDLSKIEVPSNLDPPESSVPKEDAAEAEAPKASAKKDEASSAPSPASESKSADSSAAAKPAAHKELDKSLRVMPSAARLLVMSDFSPEKIAKIKPTGLHGTITQGDVLFALGKVSSPFGSAAGFVDNPMGPSGRRANDPKDDKGAKAPAAPQRPLTGAELRRVIVQGMTKATAPKPIPSKPASARMSDAEFNEILGDYKSLLPPSAPSRPAAPPAPAPAPKDEYAGLY